MEEPTDPVPKVEDTTGTGQATPGSENGKSKRRLSCGAILLAICTVAAAIGIAIGCLVRTDEHLDDDDKFTHYYPFIWSLSDEGMPIPQTGVGWHKTRAISLEVCVTYCQSYGSDAGVFYEEIDGKPGYKKLNCFCVGKVNCIANAPVGVAFSRNEFWSSPSCNMTFCDFYPSVCNLV